MVNIAGAFEEFLKDVAKRCIAFERKAEKRVTSVRLR